MINPELLYVSRESTFLWIISGITVPYRDATGLKLGIAVLNPPTIYPLPMVPLTSFIALSAYEGPVRRMDREEHRALLRKYLAEEHLKDTWFVQQQDLGILRAYNAGFAAASDEIGKPAINPIMPNNQEEEMLHCAWQRGYDRYRMVQRWREERYR